MSCKNEPQKENLRNLKEKDKRANAKLHKSNKPRYISKAEREKIAAQQQDGDELNSENNKH